jgi:hypothetical protein
VAKAVRGPLPLRHIVRNQAGRLHRGLAELGIARDLTLDALAFGMQQIAQAFKFADQIFDLGERRAGDALDQRIDTVDGGLGIGFQGNFRRRSRAARRR